MSAFQTAMASQACLTKISPLAITSRTATTAESASGKFMYAAVTLNAALSAADKSSLATVSQRCRSTSNQERIGAQSLLRFQPSNHLPTPFQPIPTTQISRWKFRRYQHQRNRRARTCCGCFQYYFQRLPTPSLPSPVPPTGRKAPGLGWPGCRPFAKKQPSRCDG